MKNLPIKEHKKWTARIPTNLRAGESVRASMDGMEWVNGIFVSYCVDARITIKYAIEGIPYEHDFLYVVRDDGQYFK